MLGLLGIISRWIKYIGFVFIIAICATLMLYSFIKVNPNEINAISKLFASIANYLSKRGWDGQTTWGREVSVPKNFDTQLFGRKIEKSIQSWHNLGVRKANGNNLPLSRGDLEASIIRPEEGQKPYFMVYNNYNVIMNWNRSLYFATAVGLLSDAIGNL